MTLSASPTCAQQDTSDFEFDFNSAGLTGHIRKFSEHRLTGYWTIDFAATEGCEAVQWYICLQEGNVVYSGTQVPQCHHLIEILLRSSRTRKGVVGKSLKALLSSTPEQQLQQFKQTVRYLIVAGLAKAEDMEQCFKTYVLNDFDRYLVYPGKGHAYFTETHELQSFIPIHGFELDTILLESIRRRVEWTAFKPEIPSVESLLVLASQSRNSSTLPESQLKLLKGLIQDGKNIIDIAQSMGKDSLTVAKSFQNLIQQRILILKSDDLEEILATAPTERAPEVFIVDDSPVLIRQFRNLLEHWGYVVHASEDSETAVEKIQQIRPDVIFLDINMPVVSGFDLIKQIRRQDQLGAVPLVMLTAEKSVSNQWRAQWASCKFLAKPLSPDDVSDFRNELKEVLRTFVPLVSDVLV